MDHEARAIFDSITDAFIVLDADWRIQYVNAAAESINHKPADAFLGRTNWEEWPASVGTEVERQFRRALAEQTAVHFEHRYVAPGYDVWLEIRAYPFRSGLAIAYRDITERKWTEKRLRDSEERYRSLVQATSAFVWMADRNGEFSKPQPGWAEYTGQTWEEYRGLGWISAVHPEDRARVAEAWREAVENRSIYETECRAWHAASGTWRHCQTRGVPVVRADGAVREWIAAVADVNERKLWEAKLQHEDKLDSLGVLAGGVAHDFNNLLLGILGNATLARDASGAEQQGYLEQIEQASQRAAALTRQMLAYAGKQHSIFEALELSREVREVVGLVRSSVHPSAQVELELAEKLPAIRGDRTQIQQVVMNLVINAGEALGGEGGRIRIATSAESGGRVGLTVEDNGAGMTAEVKARIFDPFFTTKFMGRGLGLAAVIGIVRAHRGTMEVESAPGRGSTFRLWFPACDAPATPGGAAAVAAEIRKIERR
jgi:PAS domain S-box-containing protein